MGAEDVVFYETKDVVFFPFLVQQTRRRSRSTVLESLVATPRFETKATKSTTKSSTEWKMLEK
jgi:hypothetical protein